MSVAFRQAVKENGGRDKKKKLREEALDNGKRVCGFEPLAQSNAPPKTNRSAPLRLCWVEE
jgi:hypothetical protein